MLVQIKKSVSMRLDAATPSVTVEMDQTNNAVSIVIFFYICCRLRLSYSESNVKVSYTYKQLKKKDKGKKEKLFTENPTFTIISPEQNFDAHYMQ